MTMKRIKFIFKNPNTGAESTALKPYEDKLGELYFNYEQDFVGKKLPNGDIKGEFYMGKVKIEFTIKDITDSLRVLHSYYEESICEPFITYLEILYGLREDE